MLGRFLSGKAICVANDTPGQRTLDCDVALESYCADSIPSKWTTLVVTILLAVKVVATGDLGSCRRAENSKAEKRRGASDEDR